MEFHPCHFHNSSWIVILSKSNIRWKIWKHYIFYSHSKFRDPLGGTSSPALVHKHLKKVNWVSNSIFHRCINVWSWYVKFRVSMIQSNVHSSGPPNSKVFKNYWVSPWFAISSKSRFFKGMSEFMWSKHSIRSVHNSGRWFYHLLV